MEETPQAQHTRTHARVRTLHTPNLAVRKPIFFTLGAEGPNGPPTRRNARQHRGLRLRWWPGRWRRRGGLIRPRAASTIYLLKGRGRGRVVTQRCFGPTRSLAAPSAATFKVAASGAAHERLSPTSGRAGRVVRMGQERGVRGGQGRRGEPRRRCEVAGRAQAGGANTSCVQGHCARARVGGARTFRLDLGLLARR